MGDAGALAVAPAPSGNDDVVALRAELRHDSIREIRGRGLLIGIELDRAARPFCEELQERGVLCKETHDFVIRLAPPLVVKEEDLDFALEQLRAVLG